MVTSELLQFISQESSDGKDALEIKAALSTTQWSESDIDEALRASGLTTVPLSQDSKHVAPKKTRRYVLLHIAMGLFLGYLLIYLFLFIENNYFRHGLDVTQVLNGSSEANINPSYAGQLHNDERKNEVVQLGRLLYAYQHADGITGPPPTNGKIVNIDDPTKPLNKPISFGNYTIMPDPIATKYHYTYESDGTSYEITCVQTDTKDENKVISLFAVKDGDQLFLDPITREPIAQ